MGYYTYYTVDIHEGDKAIDEILQTVGEEFSGLNYAVDINGEPFHAAKWYDHDNDMLNLSKKYPDIVFSLYGEGDETGALWCKFYKDGKKQECYAEVTFPDYDPLKLS